MKPITHHRCRFHPDITVVMSPQDCLGSSATGKEGGQCRGMTHTPKRQHTKWLITRVPCQMAWLLISVPPLLPVYKLQNCPVPQFLHL